MSDRAFRTPESFYAESVTREMLVDYLTERGFTDVQDNRKFHGKVESQTIHATAPTGERLVIRVRLCWRRRNASETYSAAQLLPKVKNEDWVGTLQAKVNREVAEGITHSLFVQRELNNTISHAEKDMGSGFQVVKIENRNLPSWKPDPAGSLSAMYFLNLRSAYIFLIRFLESWNVFATQRQR